MTTLKFDGAARNNPGEAAIGYSITINGTEVETESQRIGYGTNNEAEYRALIEGLEAIRERGHTHVTAIGDSELIVKQFQGKYKCNATNLRPLYERAKTLADSFDEFAIQHTSRENNTRADALANRAFNSE